MTEKKFRWQDMQFWMATKHEKAAILSPLFETEFGQTIQTVSLDTDLFGTFSGEIERPSDQKGTALQKLLAARSIHPTGVLIVSEGAFFPYPDIPLLNINVEILLLHEPINDVYIWSEHTSLQTNAARLTTSNWREAKEFAEKLGYPETGIILMSQEIKVHDRIIVKNLHSFKKLEEEFILLSKNETVPVILETDLRAMRNPIRRQNIFEAGKKLIEHMQSYCPSCSMPGYSIQSSESGLPCAWCNTPTRNTAFYIWKCINCNFEEKKPVDKPFADPGTCDQCNP